MAVLHSPTGTLFDACIIDNAAAREEERSGTEDEMAILHSSTGTIFDACIIDNAAAREEERSGTEDGCGIRLRSVIA